MCFAIPGKIVELNGEDAVVDYSGERREAKNYLGAELGEWVIVSNKIIITKVDKERAESYIETANGNS